MKKIKMFTLISILLLIFSITFTVLVKKIDVKPIGPEESEVGFAKINQKVHNTLKYNDNWYKISKYCGMIPICIACFYAGRGIGQLAKEKSFKKINRKLYVLGAFYVLLVALYLFFEKVIINYRPVLEDGKLEASYPSSHTLLAICICLSSIIISKDFISNQKIRKIFDVVTGLVMLIIVFGRLLSGVHWLTDIIGGTLISLFMVSAFYISVLRLNEKK